MEALVAGRRGLRRIRAAPADDDACCDAASMGSLCVRSVLRAWDFFARFFMSASHFRSRGSSIG